MGSYDCCLPDKQEYKKIKSLSSLLKLVAEPSRLKLLCVLRQGKHCVCEIVEHFDMSQSLISHHFADLKKAGLVKSEPKGRRIYYSLTTKGQRVSSLIFNI